MQFYPLYSGSTGNSSLVVHGKEKLLVDAGVTGKAALYALSRCGVDPHELTAILISHEHSDHIKGAGILSRKFDLPIYANEKTWNAIGDKLGMIADKNIRMFETDREFTLGDIDILPFAIPHDTADPVAFTFFAKGKKLAVATDMGHVTAKAEKALSGADLLLIESNHNIDLVKKSSYPKELQRRILGERGHLSNEACGELLCRLYKTGVKRAVLGHLSRENNTEELAYASVSAALAQAGIGTDYMLKVAHFDRVCGEFEV